MDAERKVFLETRLRNIKRKHAKLIQHAELTDDALELKKEIDNIENQLNSLN